MKKRQVQNKPFLIGLAYKINPTLGKIYEASPRFINDGIVELTCLIIANIGVFFLSVAGFIGWSLVLLNLCCVTPLTFCIKYVAHKHWVWRKENEDKHNRS